MRYLFLLLLAFVLVIPAFGERLPTDKGTLLVDISTVPAVPKIGDEAKLKIDFVNPNTNTIQEHIDYRVLVTKDGVPVFGPIPLTHTSGGSVTIPVEFRESGEHKITVDVEGILFQPIPQETATFTMLIASAQENANQKDVWAQTIGDTIKDDLDRELASEENKIPGKAIVLVYSNTNWSGNVAHGDGSSSTKDGYGNAKFVANCGNLNFVQGLFQKQGEGGWIAVVIIQNGKIIGSESTNAAYGIAHATGQCSGFGGGCLIATATYGSELAPQVQLLREIRDEMILTGSGAAFMNTFNSVYYTFSPAVADLERQNPAFKEAARVALTPMLWSMSILSYVEVDSEYKALGYGIGIILLNVGLYFVAPVVTIMKLRNRR